MVLIFFFCSPSSPEVSNRESRTPLGLSFESPPVPLAPPVDNPVPLAPPPGPPPSPPPPPELEPLRLWKNPTADLAAPFAFNGSQFVFLIFLLLK